MLSVKRTPSKKRLYMNNQLKRTMMSGAGKVYSQNLKNIVQNTYNYCTHTRSYTIKAVKFKKKAAEELANDDNGKHTHIIQNFCILKGCENKKCSQLCDQFNRFDVKGHNTHRPPVGRIVRFVDSQDADGNTKSQYFVRTNKNVTVTETEKQNYGKDIKEDAKQTTYIQNHNDKYDS